MRNVLKILLTALVILSFSYLTYLLTDLGFFSNKILLAGLICFIILVIFILLGLFIVKKKFLKIILIIISFIIIIVNFIGIYYLESTLKFIDNVGNKKEQYDYYYVFVLKNSEYTKLKKLQNKIIGSTNDLNPSVLDKITINYEDKKFESKENLVEKLYKNSVDAILISDVEAYMLEEEISDFVVKTKLIHTFKIKKQEEIEPVIEYTSMQPFAFYISGIDTNGSISKVSRSDVNIVVTVNPITYQVLLTTIPRDYYVQLHGTTGVKDKLTHAGIYGINKSVTTIEDLLNIDISYYARVNFDTVTNLVDALNGVTIYSDQTLNFCDIKLGYNNLDGACALRFARERKSYKTGDRHRGENQEEVIKAIIEKVQNTPSLLTKYNSILNDLKGNFETNISLNMVKDLIKVQVKNMPKWTVKTSNLDGYDSRNYTYSGGRNMLYVMEPNLTTVENTKNIIKSILEGKTFDEIGI